MKCPSCNNHFETLYPKYRNSSEYLCSECHGKDENGNKTSRTIPELIQFYLDNFNEDDFEIANHVLTWTDEEKAAFRMAYMNYKNSVESDAIIQSSDIVSADK